MKQTNEEKIARSLKNLEALRAARGGSLLESHRKMGNDPSLVKAFLDQYVNTNKSDVSIPRKYRELIVMAIGMATGTQTTMKVHSRLACSQLSRLLIWSRLNSTDQIDDILLCPRRGQRRGLFVFMPGTPFPAHRSCRLQGSRRHAAPEAPPAPARGRRRS